MSKIKTIIELLKYLFKKKHNEVRGMLSRKDIVFLTKLSKQTDEEFINPVLCEIGSFCGKSTIVLASALSKGTLYAIDPHGVPGKQEDTYNEFITNLHLFNVRHRVNVIKELSKNAINVIPDKINLLWIDGNHDYENVKKDYINYEKKIVSSGYLVFHDACWTTYKEPVKLIRNCVLMNENYRLYGMSGNIMAFKKEKKSLTMLQRIILKINEFVCCENRSMLKRTISAIMIRII